MGWQPERGCGFGAGLMLVGKHQDGLCAERGTLETVLHMSALQQINGDFRASFRILHTT